MDYAADIAAEEAKSAHAAEIAALRHQIGEDSITIAALEAQLEEARRDPRRRGGVVVMAERRHVKTLSIDASREVFETWLNNLPGRLFQCGPHPANPHTWLAITIEEYER